MRSLVVLRACQSRWLVDNADRLLSSSKRVFGAALVNWVVGHTFYKQFVAGECAPWQRAMLRLSSLQACTHGAPCALFDVQHECHT